MDGDELPKYSDVVLRGGSRQGRSRHRHRITRIGFVVVSLVALYLLGVSHNRSATVPTRDPFLSISRLLADRKTCAQFRSTPSDPRGLRERNARYLEGQPATLIRNASVWTGEPAQGTSPDEAHSGKGWSWMSGQDVLLEHGLIKRIASSMTDYSKDVIIYEAHGRPLTAGIVDMHSHTGVYTLPQLRGNSDDNELSSDITPYVRSIDGFNPLDPQLQVIKSGGVTTSLILPGSGNNIGGEAYVIKHAVGREQGRPEISAESMLFAPEDRSWRYMKMACGENPKSVYGRVGRDFGPFSRLGEAWYFRHAFEQARTMVQRQDDWCAAADRLGAENMPDYLPQELEWESLAAVLRGKVLINTHCYTVPDLEAFVKHTNEFGFSVRAFHHAHQTYLVPEILKRAYNASPAYVGPPAAALFADNMYYKDEAYIASEQAGAILYDNGITPVYVSDNPVLNAQHVVSEAAKAYGYGLPYHAALAGVTSAPAALLGLGDRIGKVKEGFDADVVVWDSDPLAVASTPWQVWIDGTAQFKHAAKHHKVAYEPRDPKSGQHQVYDDFSMVDDVVFAGLKKVYLPGYDGASGLDAADGGNVVIRNGSLSCVGTCVEDVAAAQAHDVKIIYLRDGHLASPATSFGSMLGLQEIMMEETTRDGDNDENSFSAAFDGLILTPKNLDAAYRHGVTRAITAPSFRGGGHKGLSVGFRTGAVMTGKKHAVWSKHVSIHYTLSIAAKQGKTPTLSSAVGALRLALMQAVHRVAKGNETEDVEMLEEYYLDRAVQGSTPLVVTAHSADVIASLLDVKAEAEAKLNSSSSSSSINLIVFGGAESWILAKDLAEAQVGVVLAPLLSYSETWDQRRSLTGAPLTMGTAVDRLHAAGVKVAISTSSTGDWETRDLHLLAGIAHANSDGSISETEALAMVSSKIYEMLQIPELSGESKDEFVIYEGSPLEIGGVVRAVADGTGKVGLWR